MRLAYFTHYFPPESNAPAARVHELSRALVAQGHSVHVVTGKPNHPRGVLHPGYRASGYRHELVDGIEVHRCPTFPAANRGVLLRSFGFAALPLAQVGASLKRLPVVDCVLATSPQILTGLAGLGFAKRRRVPFFLEVRDLWPESIVSVGALSKTHPIVRVLERVEHYLYRSSTGVVAVADSFVDHFCSHGVAREQIAVVKNGVDPRNFDRALPPTNLHQQLNLPPEARVIVFCGTIGMAHDVGLLARAVAELGETCDPPIHVVIVGDGADRQHVVDEVETLGVGDRVHVLSPVARGEVAGLLAGADLAAVVLRDHPTFAGVLPSKMFEAMAMATPILLGVRGEALRLLQAAECGFEFPPGDVTALAACLRRLARMPRAQLREAGDRGYAYVREHFHRGRQATQLARFLAERMAAVNRPTSPVAASS